MSIISIILLVILSTFLLIYNIKLLKFIKLLKLEKLKEEEKRQQLIFRFTEKEKEKIDEELAEYHLQKAREYHQWIENQKKEKNIIEERLVERKQAVEEIIEQLEFRRREAENAYQKAILNGQEKINIELEGYRKVEVEKLNNNLATEFAEKRQLTLSAFNEYSDQLAADLAKAREELLAVIEELEEYKKKQAAYNAEILRRRELDEKQDFYRIVLEEQDKEDIHYLISILNNIKNKQLLYKLIWSEYLQKPFNEMLKRVLEGKDIKCVIYKITNLKTGEIYIGKTKAEASKRWTEHIKTSLNIGTIARSKIHTKLFEHWDEFSFEILEKVSNESLLSSREKYYISFYQSNIYGYNMNGGG